MDDQDLFRVGLRALLDSDGLHVVAEARTDKDAVAVAGRVRPDVVLLGLDERITARERTWRMAHAAPDAKIIALTDSPDPDFVIDALAAGACGYLARGDATDNIAAGIIRAAIAGEPLLSGRTTWALIERLRTLSAARMSGEALRAKLSRRELEVLVLMAEGHDNSEIACLLVISPHTVKHHVRRICEKLGAENRIQAAVRAARAGVV